MQLSDSRILFWKKIQNLSTQSIMAQIVLDTSKTQYVMYSDRALPLFSLVANFLTDKPKTSDIRGRYRKLTPAFIDRNNRIWFGGQKDSMPLLLSFSMNDLGKNLFTFPLHVGDEWQYLEYADGGVFPELGSVKARRDTMMANGKTYTELYSKQFLTKYFRNDPPRVFEYSLVDSAEYLRYDFSGNAGDTIARNVRGTIMSPIVITGIGQFYGAYTQFSFIGCIPEIHRDDQFSRVADSIGITYFSSGIGPEAQLAGAKINGKVYGTIVSVGRAQAAVPEAFSLSQNYPNPFNPNTIIAFDLPASSHAQIVVYDCLGREVAELVNGNRTAGHHKVEFDASKLRSGVYFYKLVAGSYTAVKKMLLVK
jgi:hypothetical protein